MAVLHGPLGTYGRGNVWSHLQFLSSKGTRTLCRTVSGDWAALHVAPSPLSFRAPSFRQPFSSPTFGKPRRRVLAGSAAPGPGCFLQDQPCCAALPPTWRDGPFHGCSQLSAVPPTTKGNNEEGVQSRDTGFFCAFPSPAPFMKWYPPPHPELLQGQRFWGAVSRPFFSLLRGARTPAPPPSP